jgi:hypothetical protein
MSRFRFLIAVAATSLALVLGLGVVGLLTVQTTLANTFGFGGPGAFGNPRFGGQGFGGPAITLPAELQGLVEIPPAERFSHFMGVQVALKDKDNLPLTVTVTPGTVTTVSATNLTIAANDGTTKTYNLDDKTVIRGKPVQGGAQAVQPALAKDDKVVVITLNASPTATAVVAIGPGGGPWGPFGGFPGHGR